MSTDSIPFRFKAGGNMATSVHHHRNVTSKANKPFKSKFASKGSLKDLAKGRLQERGIRRTPHQQVMSKIDRRHQARQKQQAKHQDRVRANSIFSGSHGAPRNVAVVTLTEGGDPQAAIRQLNESVDVEHPSVDGDRIHVRVERFKQNAIYMPVRGSFLRTLDTCRVADFVVLVLSAHEEVGEDGELLLKSIGGQGVSNVYAVVQSLDSINPPKKRGAVLASLKSFSKHFFPAIEKVYSLDSRQDSSNLMRSLCSSTPEGIRWRDERSYMLIEDIQWSSPCTAATDPTGEAVLTGVVRGRALKADRLVHVPEWGDFQIQSIYAAPVPLSQKKGKAPYGIILDEKNTAEALDHPTEDQDDLATIAPEEVIMTDEPVTSDFTERKGVLLDDHHYFSDGDSDVSDKPKRLPKGTSTYQAAWYLDDIPDSDSDMEDEDKDGDLNMGLTDTPEFTASIAGHMEEDSMTEAGPSEYPKSEAFIDRPLDEEMEDLETYRASRKDDAKYDLEFPDEIELHPNVLASERLAKYRGLKSLKSSNWNTSEDKPYEPPHWRQLLQLPTYAASKHKAVSEALVGGVAPGTRVSIHLRSVPLVLQNAPNPLALFSLLRHEHKHTACNCNITLHSSHPTPLKSKDSLILQVGPRRLKINPIFSSADNPPNNVHKFDRFLHPGRNAIASFIGPLTWGSVPCLVFQASSSSELSPSLSFIATGTNVPPSPSRVIAKRAILTGHPYKIHKKLVTVRYMFFNASDIAWFKALQLWTRRGRSGFIKESLGTHGYFKATFDGKINPMDAVAVSLYKRVWPREATMWTQSITEAGQAHKDGGDALLQDA